MGKRSLVEQGNHGQDRPGSAHGTAGNSGAEAPAWAAGFAESDAQVGNPKSWDFGTWSPVRREASDAPTFARLSARGRIPECRQVKRCCRCMRCHRMRENDAAPATVHRQLSDSRIVYATTAD